MRIGKTFYFEAAHRLQHHNGKCRNLHGHSYRVDVTVEGDSLQVGGPEDGMLLDFGVLSDWWRGAEPLFDHKTLLEEDDPLVDALLPHAALTQFPWPPTAERMAEWLRTDLQQWLDHLDKPDLAAEYHASVVVWETAKSWAGS